MDNLMAYRDSDDSDCDASDGNTCSSQNDFFNLNQCQTDDVTYCEHHIDRKSCWKCDMKKYEEERLQKYTQQCGPKPLKRKYSDNNFTMYDKDQRLNESTYNHKESKYSVKKNVLNNYNDFNVQHKDNRDHLEGNYISDGKCICEVNWHPLCDHSSSLLSCSMDGYIKIWNLKNKATNYEHYFDCSFTKKIAETAVRCSKWSLSGDKIFTGDFDYNVKVIDVSTGHEEVSFLQKNRVTSLCVHPLDQHMLLSGSSDKICLWDIRIQNDVPVRQYCGHFGQVRDITFLKNCSEFICCTDHVERESADRTIMAWHYESTALLSNQIYNERYTCTSLKTHPTDDVFLAQSNGNYIAVFSSLHPYKMNKKRRMGDHKVSGYGITFDINNSGNTVASGSADGNLYLYDYKTTRRKATKKVFGEFDPCFAVKFHPISQSLVAVGSWSGRLQICR